MQFTVHFAVTNPDQRKDEHIFVTGSDEKLGFWDPQKALRLEVNDEGVFTNSVIIDGKQLKFRYFLGYYLQNEDGKQSLIIRQWETHLSPRCILPAVESCKNGIYRAKVNDVFGFHAGRKMVSDGWLLDDQQNQIHLCVTGEAIKFYKSKTANQEYRIKITPMDLRNRDDSNPYDDGEEDTQDEPSQPILSYSDTEIAPLTKDLPGYARQNEFGEIFANGIDYYLYRTYSVAVEYLGFRIEIFKATGENPKLLAVGYALPSTLQNTYGKTSVPLLASNGLPVGKIYLGYLFIRPVHNPESPFKMDLSFIKHWKKRTTLEVGHRGMGNSYTKCAAARENTLHSLDKAASHGADYVEFDVQLTKDKIPVIFHDFHVMVSVAKRSSAPEKDVHQIAVKDLKLDQLRLLHLDHVQHHSSTPLNEQITKVTGENDEAEDLRPFPTLVEALQNVSIDVGFNIEIKFPMIQEDGINECENYFEHNEFLDRILRDVFLHAGKRRVVFSSFDPDICMMVAAKQNKYPVLFLCVGANTRHQVYQDARTQTSLTAVNFAAGCGILGVNFHSEDVLRDHSPITKAKELGLISFVWGDELNDKANVEFLKKTVGVDGVIYDRIGETESRSSVFMLEKAKKTELFAKKTPSPIQSPRANSVQQLNEPPKFPQTNGPTSFSQSIRHNNEWPVAARRRSPTTTDAETREKHFAASHGLNQGYLPLQLTTAREI